jgi:hypothetical protein
MNVDFKEIKDYFYNNRYRDNTTRLLYEHILLIRAGALLL